VSVIGAISLNKFSSDDIGRFDGRQRFGFLLNIVWFRALWAGAVVVMDNLPAHKVAAIEPLIQAAGHSDLSPYRL